MAHHILRDLSSRWEAPQHEEQHQPLPHLASCCFSPQVLALDPNAMKAGLCLPCLQVAVPGAVLITVNKYILLPLRNNAKFTAQSSPTGDGHGLFASSKTFLQECGHLAIIGNALFPLNVICVLLKLPAS